LPHHADCLADRVNVHRHLHQRYEVVDTPFGTSYGAYRPAEPDTYYWRIAHFLFPFYTMIPTGILGMQVLVRAWVPVDDEHVMFWSIGVPRSREGRGSAGGASGMTAGGGPSPPPGTATAASSSWWRRPTGSAGSGWRSTRTTTT
jgi:hypothetical protein